MFSRHFRTSVLQDLLSKILEWVHLWGWKPAIFRPSSKASWNRHLCRQVPQRYGGWWSFSSLSSYHLLYHLYTYYVHHTSLLSWLLLINQGGRCGAHKAWVDTIHIFALLGKDSRSSTGHNAARYWVRKSHVTAGIKETYGFQTTIHQDHSLHSDLAIWGTDCYRLCSLPSYLCHPLRGSVARYSVVLFASTAPGVSGSNRYVTLNNPPTLSGPYFSHLPDGIDPSKHTSQGCGRSRWVRGRHE